MCTQIESFVNRGRSQWATRPLSKRYLTIQSKTNDVRMRLSSCERVATEQKKIKPSSRLHVARRFAFIRINFVDQLITVAYRSRIIGRFVSA